jgi:hypothetical protein
MRLEIWVLLYKKLDIILPSIALSSALCTCDTQAMPVMKSILIIHDAQMCCFAAESK